MPVSPFRIRTPRAFALMYLTANEQTVTEENIMMIVGILAALNQIPDRQRKPLLVEAEDLCACLQEQRDAEEEEEQTRASDDDAYMAGISAHAGDETAPDPDSEFGGPGSEPQGEVISGGVNGQPVDVPGVGAVPSTTTPAAGRSGRKPRGT